MVALDVRKVLGHLVEHVLPDLMRPNGVGLVHQREPGARVPATGGRLLAGELEGVANHALTALPGVYARDDRQLLGRPNVLPPTDL